KLPLIRVYIKVKARINEHDIRGYPHFPFRRVERENAGFRWLTWNGTAATEDLTGADAFNERFDVGTFRAVSQCFMGYEFVENTTTYDLEDGLNIGVFETPDNTGDDFFWPDDICLQLDLFTDWNNVQLPMSRPMIVLNDHEEENTIWHEFGHFVMWNVQDHCWTEIVSSTTGHRMGTHENPRVEWTEGFASGMMAILDLHYHYLDEESNLDGGFELENEREFPRQNGYLSEYYLTMAMRDLFDEPTQVTNCFNYNPAGGINQPDVVDIGDPNNNLNWDLHDDNFEFPLQMILDAVEMGSNIDPDGNGQISSIGEFCQNIFAIADCEERVAISIIFRENLIAWWDEEEDPRPVDPTFLSADRIGIDGAEEVRNGANTNVDAIVGGFSRFLDIIGFYDIDVDFTPLNLDVNELNSTTGDFNFPVSDCMIDRLFVTDDATLFINSSTQGSDWINALNAVPQDDHIEVDVYGNLEILSDGDLIIGDDEHSAEVTIFNRIDINGDLVVNDNSTLIIDEDAFFVFGPTGTINLAGDNAVIIIKGRLTVEHYKEFTFTGSGKIIFDSHI
ncbi:MAG: hypothetical protein KDC92_17705, partial [Bacteroidetes bacterium]|nr:hypothetical protein [Bacteroidota bacterium]